MGHSRKTPTLIWQGTRDEFGTRDEVSGYALSDEIEILWLEDCDHDLKPSKAISGFTAVDHFEDGGTGGCGVCGQGCAI